MVSIEGVIEHGAIRIAADSARGVWVTGGADRSVVRAAIAIVDAHEALEEGGTAIAEAVVVAVGIGGIGGGVFEVEDAAVEVVGAGDGAGVVAGIAGVGEEHLGAIVVAGGAFVNGELVAIDAVGEEVLDLAAAIEVMAEDVIGDGDGDGGVGFAIGLAGLELGLGEEAITQEGEGGDDLDEFGALDLLGVWVDVEFVD